MTNPATATVENPEEICDLITLCVRYIPLKQLGTCDDAAYSDDWGISRSSALAKIAARIEGTQLARERFAAMKKLFNTLCA